MFSTISTARVAAPARRAAPSRGFRVATTATARVDRCDKSKVMVSPSILSANFAKLGEQVSQGAWRAGSRLLRRPGRLVAAGRRIKCTNPIGH